MNEEILKKLYESAKSVFDMPSYEQFALDMQDDTKLNTFRQSMSQHYDMPEVDKLKADLGFVKKKEDTESVSLDGSLESRPISELEFDGDTEFQKKFKSTGLNTLSNLARIPAFVQEQVITAFGSEEDKKLLNDMPFEQRETALATISVPGDISAGWRDSSESLRQKAKEIESTIEQYDQSITEDIGSLQLGRAAYRLFNEVGGAIPSIMQAMVPVVGLASMGVSTAAGKSRELQEEGEALSLKTSATAALYGTAEAALETVTRGIGKKFFKSLSGQTDEYIKTGIKEFGKQTAKDFGKEGLSELGTEILQNMTDYLIQGDEDAFNKELSHYMDIFIIGGVATTPLSAGGQGIGLARQVAQKRELGRKLESSKYTDLTSTFVDPTIDTDTEMVAEPQNKKFLKFDLDQKVEKGELTQVEADQVIKNFDNTIYVKNELKGLEIPAVHRTNIANLILEKRDLKAKVEGKDPVLVAKDKERLDQIDKEIKNFIETEQELQEAAAVVEETPSTEETSGVVSEKLSDIINRPVTVNQLGGSKLDTPIVGDLYIDGQQVVVEDANGNLTEIGNVQELGDTPIDQLGIEYKTAQVNANPDGTLSIGEKTYSIQEDLPTQGLVFDKEGNVIDASVKDETGKPVMFKGSLAEDIAYQVLLKKATSPEQAETINQLLEQDDEFRKATGITQATTDQDTEQVAAGNRLLNEPLQDATEISNRFAERKGLDTGAAEVPTALDTEKSTRIAKVFDKLKPNPKDPNVKKAYKALATEVLEQYQELLDAGYVIEIDNGEPYKNSAEMIADLRDNKRIKIFSTEAGFGSDQITDQQREDNPMLDDSGLKDANGNTLLVNDVFRAVHDFFGHAKLGNSFGPKGEEIAWRVHSKMFSPDARRAMTTETRGQNSWVNFSGVNEAAFAKRDQARVLREQAEKETDNNKKRALLEQAEKLVDEAYAEMRFAEQKIGLLPDEFVFEDEAVDSNIDAEVDKLSDILKGPNVKTVIDNVKKALSAIAPDVKFVIHKTEEAYAKATNEQDLAETSAGSFNPKTRVIHINAAKADARTVYHEAFHAMLLTYVKSNAEAKVLTERMIKAVMKAAPDNVKAELESFAANYDANIQSEEKLAELFGMLASEYKQLPTNTQGIVKRFLDRIAKALGLKPFTDSEVIDVLNSLARKISAGEVIEEKDIAIAKGLNGNLSKPSKESESNLSSRKRKVISDTKSMVKPGSRVSTRLPKSDDVHSSSSYIVSMDEMESMASENKKAESQYIKIANELSGYGITRTVQPKNFEESKKVISEFKKVVKSNLKWLYESFDQDTRDISKLWYDGANKISNEIAESYNLTIDQVSGVMAVLSPQMDWFRNLSLGRRVIDIHSKQQSYVFDSKMEDYINSATSGTGNSAKPLFSDKEGIIASMKNKKLSDLDLKYKAIFIRVYDEVYNTRSYENITPSGEINGLVRVASGEPGKIGWGGFSTIEKAVSIIEDGSVQNISNSLGSMHKVRNFFNNISDPNDDKAVTIDTHAVGAALMLPLSGSSNQVLYNFGGAGNVDTGMTGSYAVYADAYREVANEYGLLPREVQSITWEAVRGLFKSTFKSNKSNEAKINDVWAKYISEGKSLDSIRDEISNIAGGISKPVWYEYVADGNEKSIDVNSAASDQANSDEITESRKQLNNRISSIIQKGKENGISDAAILKYLRDNGFDVNEGNDILDSINQQERKAKQKAEGLFDPEKNVVSKFLDTAYKTLMSGRGYRPISMQLLSEYKDGALEAEIRIARNNVKKIERAIKGVKDKKAVIESIDKFMRGEKDHNVPASMMGIVSEMRTHLDNLSKKLVDSGAVPSEESRQNIINNLGSYLNRSYEVYDNKNYAKKVTEEVKQAAKNKLREIYRDYAEAESLESGVPVEVILKRRVDQAIDGILNQDEGNEFVMRSKEGAKNLTPLEQRKDIPAEIRALMGEYGDPAMNYVRSIQKVAAIIANQNFQKQLRTAGEGVYLFTEKTGIYNVKIAGDSSESMDVLAGMYTSKDIAEAMSKGGIINLDFGKFQPIYDFYLKSVGSVKYTKTILSIGTHAKNVIGNIPFMLMTGNFNLTAFNQAIQALRAEYSANGKPELLAKMDEYTRLGIINQSTTLSEIKDLLSSGKTFEDVMIDKFSESGYSRVKRKTKGFFRFTEKAYQVEDDFFKIAAYESEKVKYAKSVFKKNINELTDSELKETNERAATVVKNVLPNYSRVGGYVKLLKALPIAGTFISFTSESVRTSYNTIDLTFKEIADPKTRSIGVQRLAGIMSLAAVKAGIIAMWGLSADEEDEDELKNARKFLPFWDTNATIAPTEIKDGQLKYRSISASDPHGYMTRVFNAYINADNYNEGLTNALKEAYQPWLNPDMTFSVVSELISNRDKNGKAIFKEGDTTEDKALKITQKLWKIAEPGTVTSVFKIRDSKDRVNEAIGQFTGFKEHNIDVLETLGYKSSDLQRRANESASDYSKAKRIYERGDITIEQLRSQYSISNEKKKAVYQEAIDLYNGAMYLGVDPREIEQKMMDWGIPKYVVIGIQQGFIPDMNE